MRVHHLGRLAAAVLVAAATLGTAGRPAGPAHADNDKGVDLVLPILAPMSPGQQGWLAAVWTADRDVCNVQITMTGTGLTVGYPANTGTFSSFYVNSALAKDNIDYSAFNVAVGGGVTGPATVTLAVSYQELPANVIKKSDDLRTKKFTCSGTRASQTFTATLPVLPSVGAAVVQRTAAASVPRSTPTWTEITFRGSKPNLGNFRVTVTPTSNLVVTYPGDGTSAGLNDAPTLPVNGDDHVAVRLDTSKMAVGNYSVPVRATYTGGAFDGVLLLTVT